jgi:crotonobetainyl-CoA:carnitine CoA-transferase CaiB-like acyl-CoA transferase
MYDLLKGIRIIDFTHVWQGPLATLMLADFGADVIKIERPNRGDWSRAWGPFKNGMSLPFAGLNRNKRSISIDFKSEKGKAQLQALLADADVLVHNFRPGVDQKNGIDYVSLHKKFPRLVYASSSGWGDQGPDVQRGRAGHAQMAAAEGGLFSPLNSKYNPAPPSISVDHVAGLILCNAILSGLMFRERTGKGVCVTTDLLSASLSAHVWDGPQKINKELSVLEEDDLTATEQAIGHCWATSDGYIEVSPVFSDNPLQMICDALGIPEIASDIKFATSSAQLQNSEELREILANRFVSRTTEEWFSILEAQGILCARINTPAEALDNPQAKANDMIVNVDHPQFGELKLLGCPIRVNRRKNKSMPPPLHGEHTKDILEELNIKD